MDTKWKKWKSRIATLLFILGLSSILMCIGTSIHQISLSYDRLGAFQFGSQQDYQKTESFKNYINEKLNICLSIANGTYADWSYYNGYDYGYDPGYNYDSDYENDYGESAEGYTMDDPEITMEEMQAFLEENGYYDYGYTDNLTPEEKNQMAESLLSGWKDDLNVLYQITVDGKVTYTNMNDLFHFGDGLPDGYNYIMYFDGEKVCITKDGKEMDVYGDGIYYTGLQYAFPGYSNYTVDSNLKNTTVTLIAIKIPMQYRVAGRVNDYECYSDTYYLYNNLQSVNQGWQKVFLYGVVGILLLLPAILLHRSRREIKEKLAAFLNQMWIEVKLLLILLAASVSIHAEISYNGYIGEIYSYTTYSGSFNPSLYDLARNVYSTLFENPLCFPIFFWIVYLIIFDIVYNHKKKQYGLLLLFFRSFNDKNLKMNFAKRQVRRVALLTLCTLTSFVMFGMGMVMYIKRHDDSSWAFPFIGLIILVAAFLWYCRTIRSQAADLDMLNDQIDKISKGNYSPDKMPFSGKDFEKTEENLLQIQNGIRSAVDDQLKSERMKVDLVTNVSHDLKTPLTSIISYVQFLKEEDTLPDHVKDYIRILDEKSARLGEMVQDVFSISKATSGQLPVKLEVLDLGKLLNQTIADMAETIAKGNISIRSDIAEHEFFIEADGQKMYRVCQNLIQNALKYSLEGSRMYISLRGTSNLAIASFRNTSKAELNQDTDFTARFVRGDSSRTDGGSGLGLSIAKSFTEACGGSFAIEINDDAFIVTISFERRTPTPN